MLWRVRFCLRTGGDRAGLDTFAIVIDLFVIGLISVQVCKWPSDYSALHQVDNDPNLSSHLHKQRLRHNLRLEAQKSSTQQTDLASRFDGLQDVEI